MLLNLQTKQFVHIFDRSLNLVGRDVARDDDRYVTLETQKPDISVNQYLLIGTSPLCPGLFQNF